MTYFRMSGVVKRCETRNGVSKSTGQDYSITTARVLIADLDFVQVTLSRGQAEPAPGASVDWLVRVTASGDYLRCSFVDEWKSVAPLAAPVTLPSPNGKVAPVPS